MRPAPVFAERGRASSEKIRREMMTWKLAFVEIAVCSGCSQLVYETWSWSR
jgi:hypothetical protein